MQKKDLKKYNLPDSPGVYFFKKGEDILYIGKATSLKDRVRSYFAKDLIDTRGPLIHQMVFKAKDLDWQKTDSVLEALILEANLIKKHQPYFNTKEKDDKSFNYVCITDEELPKVLIKRGRDLEKQKEITRKRKFSRSSGRPFNIPLEERTQPDTQKLSFSYRDIYGPFTNGGQLKEALKIIRKIFPFLDDKSKNYHEFYRQLNLVPNLEEKRKYLNNIKNIKLFFEGKKKSILKNLEKEMKILAKEMRFEEAGEIKRKIFALKHINDVSLIKSESLFDNKFFAPAPFFGRSKGDKVGPSGSKNLLSNKLVRVGGGDFSYVLGSVFQGDYLKKGNSFRLEAYDIAHMSGKNMVGAMVVSINGELEKSEYKKFIVRSQQNANDTGALQEVLERRFAHKEWQYPNVIIMDGNIMQINVAKKVLNNLNINIPIVSVVKDDKHKMREILGDKEIIRRYEKEILALNTEAHRFAINFHKQKRNKSFLK